MKGITMKYTAYLTTVRLVGIAMTLAGVVLLTGCVPDDTDWPGAPEAMGHSEQGTIVVKGK